MTLVPRMKPLEEVDPDLIDQAVRHVCAASRLERPPHKEAAIAQHLSMSRELMEWVDMIAGQPATVSATALIAISIGMEVGYELGQNEARRAQREIK